MREKMESLAQAAKDLAGKAQEKVGEGADVVRDAAGKVGDVGKFGTEAVQSLTDDLNELLPAIKKAGYHVQGVDLDAAIPPKIAVHCHLDTAVSAEDRAALLESLSCHKIAAAGIRALFQVADIQSRLSVGALKPADVILELGISPAVKVRYRETDSGVTN